MKKQDGYYYVESREVDLKRMLWWIAKQWRMLIVLAIACACVMCAWKYNKDYKANQAAYEAALAEQEMNASYEALEESLTETEMLGVNRAFYYWKRAEEASDYLENSIIIKMNPYEIDVASIYYPTNEVEKISKELKVLVGSENFLEELKSKIDWDIKNVYLLELFEIEEMTNQVVVTIQADSRENCELLANATMSLVKEKFGNLFEDAYYTMGVTNNLDLVTLFNDIYDQEHTCVTIYENYEVSINSKQRTLLIRMQAEDRGEIVDTSLEEETQIIEMAKTHISVTMMFLGAVAGILVGIVLLAVIFTFSASIHGEREIKHLFALPIMGKVNVVGLKKKKWFAIIDKFVDRIVYGRSNETIYEQQVQMIVANIYLACKKINQKSVFLSGSEMERIPETFVKDIQIELQKKDITVSVGACIGYDAESLIAASETRSVVLIEVDEISRCEEIAAELNLCTQNQIESLGVIVVQA